MSDDEHVRGIAVVKAELPPETALASVARDEATVHGRIDPKYINLRRVLAFQGDHHVIAAIPLDIDVKIGDRIAVQGSYRSRSVSCGYVPAVIIDDFGPQATGAETLSKPGL